VVATNIITLYYCTHRPTYSFTKQEDRVVAGNHRAMQGTYTESLHLILGQLSELKEH